MPATQFCRNEHVFPHVPQLSRSVWRFEQKLKPPAMHSISPVGQVHAPATQVPPPLQRLKQRPQLLVLVIVSVQ